MTEKKRTREEIKRERELQRKKTKTPTKKWIKRIFLTIVLLGVLGFLSGVGLFTYYASNAPELDEELLKDPVSSEFYDINGELFASIGVENRKYVAYKDIPQPMIDAIIATEDSRFFDHFGVDIWRLGSAVIANFREGFGAQGASTITQQVVKNSFFTNEKKLERKAQEAWLAIKLERQYSKEEIFEMYFNKILMSGRVYGFGTAAEYFYGKELSELNLDEMALLAGMPQSPNNYNPFKHPERAEKRRNIVLSLMVQHEKISEAQATEAKAVAVSEGILSEEHRIANHTTNYPAFLDVVLSELEAKGDRDLISEGIKVYTTLDPKAQQIVENIMNNDANFPTEKIESGVSVLDTTTGEIRAIGGGRNYSGNFDYNFAYDLTTRAPGSTMKPLIDYGPAIENLKWSTGETIVDKEMTYSNSKQVITNWDGKYNGSMTIREALYTSRNVPAVKTLQAVGTDYAQKFISKLGIETDYVVESDAIGGGNINISPIQMAASYAAFGNNGGYNDPHSISKIVFRDGTTSKSYKKETTLAMSDYTAYMVTDILRDVVSNKANASAPTAMVSGVDIAGKTGTTNYSADEFAKHNLSSSAVPDSWFTGYTTNYSIAIWSGYSQRKDAITTWPERRLPQTLFKSIMTDLNAYNPAGTFKQPSSVVSATIEVGTSPLKLASEYTPAELRQTELFVKGTQPTEVSNEYEALVLDPPFNVKASYNDVANLIDLTWEHTIPDATEEAADTPSITYEVTMTVEGEPPTVIATTGATSVQIPNIQPGKNYSFSIVALSGETRSEPGSVSIYIEGIVEEPEPQEPVEDDQNDWTDPGDNNGTNPGENNGQNGNGSDTNNGNGNGNSNGNGNGVQPPTVPNEPNSGEEEQEPNNE
ncbi:PBP1A family penicillin-binding protein [Solibacillus sp. FSL H8-0538]|uniref:PBP1A family penicillin-binding protein n=1 Tax=Solibacillus sp. FSL H8-0538 TaxID=2921400 RepID=UPI0030F88F3F